MKVIRNTWSPGHRLRGESTRNLFRKVNIKSSTLIWDTLRGNEPVMVFDNLLYNGEPDACTRVCGLLVQPLKHLENLSGILRLEAYSIVAHGNMKVSLLRIKIPDAEFSALTGQACYPDLGCPVRNAEFERIGDQVLHHLPKLKRNDPGF